MKDYVECHFIDGPLQGTRKQVLKSDLLSNRTYRHYEPIPYSKQVYDPETFNEVTIKCTVIEYIPFSIPSSYGTDRYAMCQRTNGLGH